MYFLDLRLFLMLISFVSATPRKNPKYWFQCLLLSSWSTKDKKLFVSDKMKCLSRPENSILMPTLLPGFGPRFLEILTGSRLLPGWMLSASRSDAFWPQGAVTLVFLRPGLRPLWPGGLPTGRVGFMAAFSTPPSVGVSGLLGSTTENGQERQSRFDACH